MTSAFSGKTGEGKTRSAGNNYVTDKIKIVHFIAVVPEHRNGLPMESFYNIVRKFGQSREYERIAEEMESKRSYSDDSSPGQWERFPVCK